MAQYSPAIEPNEYGLLEVGDRDWMIGKAAVASTANTQHLTVLDDAGHGSQKSFPDAVLAALANLPG